LGEDQELRVLALGVRTRDSDPRRQPARAPRSHPRAGSVLRGTCWPDRRVEQRAARLAPLKDQPGWTIRGVLERDPEVVDPRERLKPGRVAVDGPVPIA